MKRGKSFLFTSGVGALLVLLASTASAGEIGVCPPYSKTFGPEDPPENIVAFINEINLRPGGGTVKLATDDRHSFDLLGVDPISGVVCIRPANPTSRYSVSLGGIPGRYDPIFVTSGILTLIGNGGGDYDYANEYSLEKLVVQNGGTLFAEGATLWPYDLTVEVGGFAQLSGATLFWGHADNAGTMVVRDSLLEGACGDKISDGLFVNSGRLIMEQVTFWAGCSDNYPFGSTLAGMYNTGVVSMSNVTYFGYGSLYLGPDAGSLLAGSGLYEAKNSVFDRRETDRICSTTSAPVQIVDLGYNVFNSLEHCLVDVQAGTSLEAEPGIVYLGRQMELELGPGSPGIDFIPLEECRSYDRLGRPRVDGNGDGIVACDAGALEFSDQGVVVKAPPFSRDYGLVDLSTDTALYVVFMSSAALDPATIDAYSVVLGEAGAVPRGYNLVDRNGDGVLDLRLRYKLKDVPLVCGEQTLTVFAVTTEGKTVSGLLKLEVTGCTF